MTHLSHRQRMFALVAAGALVILTLGGLTWLLLAPGDDEPIAEPATTTTSTSTSTTTTTTRPGEDAAALEDHRGGDGDGWDRKDGLPLPPMGIEQTTLTWARSELPLTGEDQWLQHLFEWDGRVIASGGTWDEATETESTLLFESTDGLTWTPVAMPAEFDGGTNIVPAGEVVVAFVNRWAPDGEPDYGVYLSGDLATWTEVDLAGFTGENEAMWLWHAAGSGDSLILAGNREPIYHHEPRDREPVIIEKDGLTLELDDLTFSFLITDDATGEVVLHGSQEQIWDHQRDEEGAVLYDPETGQRVFAMSWEELSAGAEEAYTTTPFGGDFVLEFESEGRRLAFDQYTREIVVTDITSGAVLFTGTDEHIWQGRPPTFIDPRTDTVILRLSWDEWNLAHEEAYPDESGEPDWGMAEGVLLVSRDGGATFTEVDLSGIAGEGFHPAAVTGGADGFLLVGNVEGPWLYEGDVMGEVTPSVLASSDGIDWALLDTNLSSETWISNLIARDGGFLAVAGTEFGSMILETGTGTTWTELLTGDDLQLPLGSAWFESVAEGELGLFVTGSRDGWDPTTDEAQPLVVTKHGRTLTIDGPDYTLIDDATGTVLFEFDEHSFWMVEPEPAPGTESPVRWGEGGLAIFTDDGTLLFALSHEEHWPDEGWDEPEEWYEPEQLLLRHDGSAWSSVALPAEMGLYSWFSAIGVGEDRVMLAVNIEVETGGDWVHELVVFVGTD